MPVGMRNLYLNLVFSVRENNSKSHKETILFQTLQMYVRISQRTIDFWVVSFFECKVYKNYLKALLELCDFLFAIF